MTLKISIITATWNCAGTVGDCLDSVAAPTKAREMCAEMVAHDLDQARRHALLEQHGYPVQVSGE